MKLILIFLFIQISLIACLQTKNTTNKQSDMTPDTISFITKMDITQATKDGFYLNGYVVNIEYVEAKKLDGKTIKVSGKVTIEKGLKNLPKEHDEKGRELIRQGREEDTKHIESPVIEVVKDE